MTAELEAPRAAPATAELTMTRLPDRCSRQATSAWNTSSAVIAQMGPVICQCSGIRRPTAMSAARAARFLPGVPAAQLDGKHTGDIACRTYAKVKLLARMAKKLSAMGAT